MPGYAELLAANPEAFKQHEEKVRAEEKARREVDIKAAVAEASKPRPATLAELKAIVPANMDGRDKLIIDLLDGGSTAAEAHAAVTRNLAEQVEAARQASQRRGEHDASLASAAGGAPALKLSAAAGPGAKATYMELVDAETERLMEKDVPEREARAKAMAKVSRARPDLLEAHKEELARAARDRMVEARKRTG